MELTSNPNVLRQWPRALGLFAELPKRALQPDSVANLGPMSHGQRNPVYDGLRIRAPTALNPRACASWLFPKMPKAKHY